MWLMQIVHKAIIKTKLKYYEKNTTYYNNYSTDNC